MCGAAPGAFFSIFTTILVYMDYRFGGTKQTSEQVNTPNPAAPCMLMQKDEWAE